MFLLQTRSRPLEFTFSLDFSISKYQLLLKLMFGATEFQQRPQFEIIPKALFFTLASNTNLV